MYSLLVVDVGGSDFWIGSWTHDIFEYFFDDVYGYIVFAVCGVEGFFQEEEVSSNMAAWFRCVDIKAIYVDL